MGALILSIMFIKLYISCFMAWCKADTKATPVSVLLISVCSLSMQNDRYLYYRIIVFDRKHEQSNMGQKKQMNSINYAC